MPLQPSRRDILGPPPRDVTDLAAIVRHQGSYLRQIDPGMLDGRFATPRPVPVGPTELVGDEGDGSDGGTVLGEDEDRHVCFGPGIQRFPLSYIPIEETVHLHWHASSDSAGVEWKRGDHYEIDDLGVITIYPFVRNGETWPKAGHIFSAQYLHLEGEDDPAEPDTFIDAWDFAAWDGDQELDTGIILTLGQRYRITVNGNYAMDAQNPPIDAFPPVGPGWVTHTPTFDQPQYDSIVAWRRTTSQPDHWTGAWWTHDDYTYGNPFKYRVDSSVAWQQWPPQTEEFYYSGGWVMGDPGGFSSDIVIGNGEELQFRFVVGGAGADNNGGITVTLWEVA
jgi:hypothetical protein